MNRILKTVKEKWNIKNFLTTQSYSENDLKNKTAKKIFTHHHHGQIRIKNINIGNRYFHSIDQTCFAKVTIQSTSNSSTTLSSIDFENIAEETLQSLTSYFDELLEKSKLEDVDVVLGDGVLTVKLANHGIYVINKQSPNKQIWLSSPTSGPKRYDFLNQTWIYKHDNITLYQLLNLEIPKLVDVLKVDFESNCSYGKSVINV